MSWYKTDISPLHKINNNLLVGFQGNIIRNIQQFKTHTQKNDVKSHPITTLVSMTWTIDYINIVFNPKQKFHFEILKKIIQLKEVVLTPNTLLFLFQILFNCKSST